MAIDPSIYSGFTALISDYTASQLYVDNPATTLCTDGQTIATLVPTGSGLSSFTASAIIRPTARLGSSGLNNRAVIDALISTPGEEDYTTGGALSQFLSNTGYTAFFLIKPRTITLNSATPNLNDCLVCSSATTRFGLFLRNDTTPAIYLVHNDGSSKSVSVSVSTGSWQLIVARHRNGVMSLTNGDGTWTSTAASGISNLTQAVRFFANTSGQNFYDGELAGAAFYNVGHTDQAIDDLAVRYFQDWYGSGNVSWTRFVPTATSRLVGGEFQSGAINEYGFNSSSPSSGAIDGKGQHYYYQYGNTGAF